jgi:hypothetical protein
MSAKYKAVKGGDPESRVCPGGCLYSPSCRELRYSRTRHSRHMYLVTSLRPGPTEVGPQLFFRLREHLERISKSQNARRRAFWKLCLMRSYSHVPRPGPTEVGPQPIFAGNSADATGSPEAPRIPFTLTWRDARRVEPRGLSHDWRLTPAFVPKEARYSVERR